MMRFARGIARPKVMPRTDPFNCGAAGQHRPIGQKRAESRSSSTLNQVNNEDDDSNYEQ